MITPETGQFITFGDNDHQPEVQPSTRTALVSAKKESVFTRAHVCASVKPKSLQVQSQSLRERPAMTEKRRTDVVLKSNPIKRAPKEERISTMAEPAMLMQSNWVVSTRPEHLRDI